MQFVNFSLLGRLFLDSFTRKGGRDRGQGLLLPQVDLGGMNAIFRRQLIHRLLLPYGLHGYLGLEFRCMSFAYIGHISPRLLLMPSILSRGLKYGEYHIEGKGTAGSPVCPCSHPPLLHQHGLGKTEGWKIKSCNRSILVQIPSAQGSRHENTPSTHPRAGGFPPLLRYPLEILPARSIAILARYTSSATNRQR